MNAEISSIVQYFRSCYQADLRAVHLSSFLSSKVSFQRIESDPAWASRTWHRHPVPTDWGASVYKHLLIHGKEQELYACALMLSGRIKVLNKVQAVCTPLYLIPVMLEQENNVFMAALDYGGMVVNPAFADLLQQQNATAVGENLYAFLQEQLPIGALDFEVLRAVEQTLTDVLGLSINMENLYDFPVALETSDLKKQVTAQTEDLRLIPVLGLGVIDKQAGSLGILNELETMAAAAQFSPVIEVLFSGQVPVGKKAKNSPILLPVTLSTHQEAILRASVVETLSVVNGPPGTGKSFTIAAIAADRLSKGESVLIAAKNTQAVEVIADKIERDFHLSGIPIRATQKEYRQHLRKRLKNWLHGRNAVHVSQIQLVQQRRSIQNLEVRINALLKKARTKEVEELRYGQLSGMENRSWWQATQCWFLEKKAGFEAPLSQTMQEIAHRIQEGHEKSRTYLSDLFHQRLQRALQKHRRELQRFWEALKTNSGNEKETQLQGVDFSKILDALPVWLVNSANVHRVLPLEKGLFDLVIIDEASQSDIASALPLLQRAKRAIIVGDPNQLRHVSFLSQEQQSTFARQFGLQNYMPQSNLSFRDTSILDLAFAQLHTQGQVHMLDEHFRSLPGIIAFSNQRFYDSALKIMTETPQNCAEMPVLTHIVPGKRKANGQNTVEVEAIMEAIAALTSSETELAPHLCQSIGVLSPFRGQTDALKRQLEALFPIETLERHRILIGSPFDFQGEERDVMFISWTMDATTAPGTYLYLNREDVFNVSITRARVAQHLYLSLPPDQIPPNTLLSAYVNSLGKTPPLLAPSQMAIDPFVREVLDFLEKSGYTRYWIAYPLAGMTIDLVIAHENRYYCLDFVGYPGPFQKALPLERWKMLSRLRLQCFTLSYSEWRHKRAECEGVLLDFLK